jgi:hypothetical protein
MHRDDAIARLIEQELPTLDAERRASILLDWWGIEEESPDYALLSADAKAELASADEPRDPMAAHWEPLLRAALRSGYLGVVNGYLEAQLAALGLAETVEGDVERLLACPCCRYRTLLERGDYDICPVCSWEDDGGDDPAEHSGPNHMTLAEGRANFGRLGAISERERAFVLPDGPSRYARA